MPVVDIALDRDSHSITVTADFAASVERIWQVYSDPAQLAQVWGPPGFPATFIDFDLSPGARIVYYMSGPDGEKYPGWWRISIVNAPEFLSFDDGFANQDFTDNPAMPVSHNVYEFESQGDGTRAFYFAAYRSVDDFDKVMAMGMEEGVTAAINQIDELIATHP